MVAQLQSHSPWDTGSQGIVNSDTAGGGGGVVRAGVVTLRKDVAGDHTVGNARIP